jgi:PleD family two-component response regulator
LLTEGRGHTKNGSNGHFQNRKNERGSENMKKQKVLIVDDEPLNIELMEGILSNDYEVIKASSGIEALIKVENTLPDLILLDVMMPNMNGYAVCKNLKSSNKTKSIPIVMITALKEHEGKNKAIEAGADDFVSKPIEICELGVKVKSLLGVKNQHISVPAA